MYKIVIIGEKEDILPYQSIGVEILPVKTIHETISLLNTTAKDPSVGIILITETMAGPCPDAVSEVRNKTAKAVTIVPAGHKSGDTSTTAFNRTIARAVGMDILTKFKYTVTQETKNGKSYLLH